MSAIVHETNDQGNYAAERVGAQSIDPNCSGETAGYHGWLHRVNRQSSEATVADILALEGRYQEAVQRLVTEQNSHDTTKRLLASSDTERDYYRDQFDITRRSVVDWSDEATRLQKEVIAVADGAAQARTVILTLADGLHFSQTLEAWVLKPPLGDLLRELADELRAGEKGK